MPVFSRTELADLNVFTTIVRRRSFKRAAAELGLTTSALSHCVRRLETRVGVRLLNRSSRSVVPTVAGQTLCEGLQEGFQQISDALAALEALRHRPVGMLRINIPRDAGVLLINPALPVFAQRYPQVRLDIATEDHLVDVFAEGYDAGMRYGDSVPEDMIAVPLTGPLHWVIVGAPEYLDRHGRPQTPDDLARHACLGLRIGDNSLYVWELGDGDRLRHHETRGGSILNDTETTLAAARGGVGLGYVLERRAAPDIARGALEVVLPDWASPAPGFHMYYSSRKQTQPGLRQLVDVIRGNEGLPPLWPGLA